MDKWKEYKKGINCPNETGKYLCLIERKSSGQPFRTFQVKTAQSYTIGLTYFTGSETVVAYREKQLNENEVNYL